MNFSQSGECIKVTDEYEEWIKPGGYIERKYMLDIFKNETTCTFFYANGNTVVFTDGMASSIVSDTVDWGEVDRIVVRNPV